MLDVDWLSVLSYTSVLCSDRSCVYDHCMNVAEYIDH